jgi:hypothetical protein
MIGEHALDMLVGALLARLAARRPDARRRAVIYGPGGRVLHEVDLPDADEG